MYQSIYYDKDSNKITIFDDKEGRIDIDYKGYSWKETEESEYHTIFGKPVKKVFNFNENNYEIDIHPILRTLIDRYESEEVAKNVICIWDIETSSDGGFPNVDKGDKEIYSIASIIGKEKFVLIKTDKEITEDFGENVRIFKFDDEKKMLLSFCKLLRKYKVSILVDWNGDNFDLPYFINRMKTLGLDYTLLSPIGKIDIRENGIITVGCLNHIDYLSLYKKYTMSDHASYSLDSIGNEECGINKIKHQGLEKLYKEDINKFIRYNLRDCEIIEKLEEKLNYLQIAIYVCHISHIPYEWIFAQSKAIEGSIFTFFKKNKLVGINKKKRKEDEEQIKGAYVKDPIQGLYKLIIDLDFTSLYPNIIRTLNISPETKIAKILDWDKNIEYFYKYNLGKEDCDKKIEITDNGNSKEITISRLKKTLDTYNFSIGCNGVIYDKNKEGFISKILTIWFDERVRYKKLRKEAANKKDKEKEKEYDIKQNVMKVLMNSFYGVLALNSFRFYDQDMAESVTITGKYLIKMSENNVNKYLGSKRVVYVDTDSNFITLDGWCKEDEVINKCTEIQGYVNSKLEGICKNLLNVKENKYLSLKQEILAKSGFFVAKKRYALWKISNEGIPSPEGKELEVKGIDTVRSSFPVSMKTVLKDILKGILLFEEKDKIDSKLKEFYFNKENINIEDIAINTGVKDINKYFKDGFFIKGTPVHVKASINYNNWLKKNKFDKKYHLIKNGDKVKWVYLKQNEENYQSFAFIVDELFDEVIKFVEENIDRDKILKSVLNNKIKIFYDTLNWLLPDFSENSNETYF